MGNDATCLPALSVVGRKVLDTAFCKDRGVLSVRRTRVLAGTIRRGTSPPCDMLKTMSRRPSLPEASESLRRRRRLLLLSNSRNQGQGYLEHSQDQIRDLLGERINTALFIPFASVIVSYDEFTANVREGFSKMRCQVHSLHQAADPKRAIAEAEAIVVGGGNTFQLLNTLYEKDLLGSIQERVGAGVPYIGWS